MNRKPKKCFCGKGYYQYDSALYDYYSCSHAYEKSLRNDEKGRWISNFNSYKKLNK